MLGSSGNNLDFIPQMSTDHVSIIPNSDSMKNEIQIYKRGFKIVDDTTIGEITQKDIIFVKCFANIFLPVCMTN